MGVIANIPSHSFGCLNALQLLFVKESQIRLGYVEYKLLALFFESFNVGANSSLKDAKFLRAFYLRPRAR